MILLTSIPLIFVALLSVLSPLLPFIDPHSQNLSERLTPPAFLAGGSWQFPLGTDQLGRDILSRIIVGARLTLLVALAAVFLGGALGTLVGLLAGYYRGTVDAVSSRFVDAQLAFPVILLAIAILTTLGRSIPALVAVLVIVSWAVYARIVRAETLSLRERPFIMGLKTVGVPTWRILGLHILPNLLNTIIVLATLEVGTVILTESALSFLGLGIVSPDVSWGSMLAEGRRFMQTAWWVVAMPGLAITFAVLLFSLLGDALRTRYDPKKGRS
jgi:peptide/nickel transport system permease protein